MPMHKRTKMWHKHSRRHGHHAVFMSLVVLVLTLGYVGSAMTNVTGAFLGVPPAGTDTSAVGAMFVLSMLFLLPMELVMRKNK